MSSSFYKYTCHAMRNCLRKGQRLPIIKFSFSTKRIILLNDDCLIQLLPRSHHHEIHIKPSILGPHCGLVPMGMPSTNTTTTGLQWDLSRFYGIMCTPTLFRCAQVHMLGLYMMLYETLKRQDCVIPFDSLDVLIYLWLTELLVHARSPLIVLTFHK